MFVLIGYGVALGCIFGAYIIHGGNMSVIIHALPTELMAILGGALGAFVVNNQPKVLKAPMSALFRDGEKWQAYVIEGGRAAVRDISVQRHNGLEAEIADGLQPGERLIVHPSDAVHDGTRVKPREQ